MWTPFRGSLSARSDDARNLRKLLVSTDSLFPVLCIFVSMFFIYWLVSLFLTFFICPSAFLEQEINRSLSPPLQCPLPPPCPTPSAPQPRELITIEEECERLARELKEVMQRQAAVVSWVQKRWSLSAWQISLFYHVSLTRCPGTETACGLSWPSSVSTEEFWPGRTLSQPHRSGKLHFSNNSCIVYYFFLKHIEL